MSCWNTEDLADPGSDLCVKRVNGYYDVVNPGNEGWTVYTPHGRYVHTSRHGWVNSDAVRGDGSATRDHAIAYAEQLIESYQ